MQYTCSFARGKWNPDDWLMVKSPDFLLAGEWVQHDDHITNRCPQDSTEQEMQGARSSETFAGMLLKTRFRPPLAVELEASFDYRMCPLIVFAPEVVDSALGMPEYQQDTQVVLYDQGSIVWARPSTSAGPRLIKLAWIELDIGPKFKHHLRVDVAGKQMVVSLDGRQFGCTNEYLADEFYVGIAGCEGINRFYSFSLYAGD